MAPTGTPAARTPYDAKHVAIVDHGTVVTALYIPNPEDAKDPAYVLDHILDRTRYEGVEVIAEATRFYKKDGADFSGWIVRSDLDYTDPIPNKREAMRSLHHWINDYFPQPTTPEPEEAPVPDAPFTPGQQIIVGNGTVQTVVKMADRIGNEPQRVEVESGLAWLASECEPAPRFVVRQAAFNRYAVLDTRTDICASTSTSRSGAQHIADCLTDGTMVLDQHGHATVPQPAAPAAEERPACSHGVRLQPGVVLSYAKCEPGTQWGVFGDEGSLEVYDCAVQAANRAAEFRSEDPDTEYGMRQVCKEHPDEAYGECTECGDFN